MPANQLQFPIGRCSLRSCFVEFKVDVYPLHTEAFVKRALAANMFSRTNNELVRSKVLCDRVFLE